MTLEEIENEIIERIGEIRIEVYKPKEGTYRYEASKRVSLDENKSIGSLLCYSVYGKSRMEAATRLLNALKKDEEEFEQLRNYYSLKGKNKEIILTQDLGNYTLSIYKNKEDKNECEK